MHFINKFSFLWVTPLLAFTTSVSSMAAQEESMTPVVSALVDVTHGYSFYTGFGTFSSQYIHPQKAANSWKAFKNLDLTHVNLMVLPACDQKVPYTTEDKVVMKKFVDNGGALVILGDSPTSPQNTMADVFQVQFGGKATPPLSFTENSGLKGDIEPQQGSTLVFEQASEWTPLVVDSAGKALMAERSLGRGKVLVLSSSLMSSRKDKKDGGVNDAWMKPFLVSLSSGKKVDVSADVNAGDLVKSDHSAQVGSLTYHWSDYLNEFAEAMIKMDTRCRPTIEKCMGVPLSAGMSSEVGLLATGGGGYSNGRHVGLAVFWGGFPEREDSMIEFITHENVHSWVHPHVEPFWNEPIATYVGNLVMMQQGHEEEAKRRIAGEISAAMKLDSTMKLYPLDCTKTVDGRELTSGERRGINWGKSQWIFEHFRKQDPNFIAKYFRAKRKLVPASLPNRYSLDDAVAVMSVAMGKNLFPWFNEHGMSVDKAKVQFPIEIPDS